MQNWFIWIKQHLVLLVAALAALLTIPLAPPSAAYLEYIDFSVLALLFCLMMVVALLQGCGLFTVLAQKLLAGKKQFRYLCLALVLLPFFSAMLITNDVALLAFVPFTILVLCEVGRPRYLIYLISLQTVAANLGSMATPIGNPQNLYLYSYFQLSFLEFFTALLPYILVSVLLLAAAAILVKREELTVTFERPAAIQNKTWLYGGMGLLALCLLSVLHLLPKIAVLTAVILFALCFARPLFRQVDYSLLLTFICFFIFSGNLGQSRIITSAFEWCMDKSALLTATAASQIISNVPAAVLLAPFTQNWRGLLTGVNIGGLGTLIASLASLISFQLYSRSANAKPARYLGVFTLVNFLFLAVLLTMAYLVT